MHEIIRTSRKTLFIWFAKAAQLSSEPSIQTNNFPFSSSVQCFAPPPSPRPSLGTAGLGMISSLISSGPPLLLKLTRMRRFRTVLFPPLDVPYSSVSSCLRLPGETLDCPGLALLELDGGGWGGAGPGGGCWCWKNTGVFVYTGSCTGP